MNASTLPIFYSFRRCPYAMRARMALYLSGERVELREVKLGNKPEALRKASPKATVPVLVLPDGQVIDQSLEIMLWALGRADPEAWLGVDDGKVMELIRAADGDFKEALDRFKYPERFVIESGYDARTRGLEFLQGLESRLALNGYLFRSTATLGDIAIFPFVRQFASVDKDFFAAVDLPNLKRWLETLTSSNLFESIMTKFEPWKPEDEPFLWGRQ